jgi:hypothetical protein
MTAPTEAEIRTALERAWVPDSPAQSTEVYRRLE